MEEPGVRQRKKAATGSSHGHETGSDAKSGSAFPKVYVLLAAVLVLALYNFLALVKRPLNQFLGAPTRHLPGVRTNYVPTFTVDEAKQDAVVEAFKVRKLERDAMGDDEYHPISHAGSNLTKAGGIGIPAWVADKLSFERDGNLNTFETTIRVLGGLLSAYHLSGEDPVFLEKAEELGSRILPAFETESGLPLSLINLALREGVPDKDNSGFISTAEASTLQLEFRYLAYLTDEDTYWEKPEKVMAVLRASETPSGLASIFVDSKMGRYQTSSIRLGSRGDSYYEYLLINQTELVYREMYDTAMTGIHTHLVQRGLSGQLLYTAELNPQRTQNGEIGWRLVPKQDHLVCFLGGSLMLGATTSGALVHNVSIPPRTDELTEQGERDWLTGVELINTCMATHDTQTGLAPEIAHFRILGDGVDNSVAPADWYIKGARPNAPPPFDARYILRPETVESIFIAFRLTGDPKYRDYGWAIFQAIEKHCRIPTGGYASVINVDQVPVEYDDKMETFLMSETLKYLYLLFADSSVLPLNEYVFNTEGHPLPVFNPTIRTGFS
ncbi:glycoside hydrolase family 47 protein [Suillus subalutaceus]|uniref:glycoside hydrolase family 47 protein n=1 Tax=Suillus subalutaceus TaxID=48586 RepID=UPI001B87C082|nr:glycoside hydrolase family 47 protein [Suillus subalutaceus]KAG1848535.1 glycoside hydrolase family 47 protein [Suillus subalutaceus]